MHSAVQLSSAPQEKASSTPQEKLYSSASPESHSSLIQSVITGIAPLRPNVDSYARDHLVILFIPVLSGMALIDCQANERTFLAWFRTAATFLGSIFLHFLSGVLTAVDS
jgi:hypothetical protein